MEGKEDAKGKAHLVGTREELIEAKRSFRTIEGRDVFVLYHQGTFHAMDMHCYPSTLLQELGGKLCIICPNHHYKITLAEGEGLYKFTNHKEKPPVVSWRSKGPKQRVHTVTEVNKQIYVKLSEDPTYWESDFFQGEKGKVEREKVKATEEAKSSKASPKKTS
ncbi:Rieske domain-containing protein [Merluccius polli]|uniref:Rieske domain-containing protein n=1 Tax=Merluccius polli TaxID=89951 RepID=A0AA47MYI4_MERPO|nr:Rieske domain-containing protein [Merluccius polli]